MTLEITRGTLPHSVSSRRFTKMVSCAFARRSRACVCREARIRWVGCQGKLCWLNDVYIDGLVQDRRNSSALAMDQVMACCLTAPSHFLNQLIYHQRCIVEFTWDHFHRKCSRYQFRVWKIQLLKVLNSLWPCMAKEIWVNIGSGNGLVPDGTKPLPKPKLT